MKKLAASGRKHVWSSLKGVQVGEKVLFYCQRPHSAIVATAETASASKEGEYWPYETKIHKVSMIESPITKFEIAQRFPSWPWAKNTRGSTRPPEEIAEWLWNRASIQLAEPECEVVFKAGAGFGDSIKNGRVEKAAVKFVTARLKSEGYKVATREREKIGYDLETKKRGSVLHVECREASFSFQSLPAKSDAELRTQRSGCSS